MDPMRIRYATLALTAALAIPCTAPGVPPPANANIAAPADAGVASPEVDPTTAHALAPVSYLALERVQPLFGHAPARPTLLDPVAYERGGHCRERLAHSRSGAPADCPASVVRWLHVVGIPSVIVVHAGGAAAQLTRPAEVVQVFGTIDSPEKAALIAWVARYEFGPPTDAPPLPRVRATSEGFVVEARRTAYIEQPHGDSWIDVYAVELLVRRDGTSLEQNARQLSHTRGRSGRTPTF